MCSQPVRADHGRAACPSEGTPDQNVNEGHIVEDSQARDPSLIETRVELAEDTSGSAKLADRAE